MDGVPAPTSAPSTLHGRCSRWWTRLLGSPPAQLRALVGRTLRIGGQAVGDIDAPAFANKRLS